MTTTIMKAIICPWHGFRRGIVCPICAAAAPAWFPGQLEAYTIPILRRFADRGDPGQPGNLPRLLVNLQGENDDAP